MTNKDAHLQKIEIDPNMQYILAGDISVSMSDKDPLCAGLDKYQYMLEKFKLFIKEAEDFDADGVTVMLFGEKVTTFRNTKYEDVANKLDKISYEGYTNTHKVIEDAWALHLEEKRNLARDGKLHPGTVLFIFTDGAPTNRAAVERAIVSITKAVDRHDEFNIGFLTVGTIPENLGDWLDALDDDLKEAKYDIVNVSKLEDVNFLKAVSKAVNE
jgi:hypothetical protein